MAGFIGRASELAGLRSAIDESAVGRGGLVLLAGEAGIGKTRLAEEACHYAAASGTAVVWGRCVELEGTPAYWPWIQVLRGIAQDAEHTPGGRELGDRVGEISRLVPELGSSNGQVVRAPVDTRDRFRLFDAVSRLFRWVARAQSVLVVLDDLQWCDAASVALLRHLSRDVHDFGLLVIAAYRDLEIGSRHPLAAALPELSRERGARRLKLKGFGVDDVGRYLLAVCGSVERGLVSTVHEQTAGNPFFVAELARLLLDEGELRPGALPQGVREVIRRRLEVLSDECNRVLEVASVLGRDFELDLLCETARLPVPRVLQVMDEAVGAALVNPLRDQPGRYGFVHDLVRETLYQELPTPIRVQLHEGAAESLERRPGDGQLAALAHHWFQAAPAGAYDKAASCAVRAAEQALDKLAYEEAARLYRMALDNLAGRPADDLRRCRLLIDLADSQYRSGDLTLSLKSCDAAARIARALGRADLQAEAALVVQGVGDPELEPTLQRLCEDALRAVGGQDLALRARLLGQLTNILEEGGRPERNDALSREAMDLAERCQDADALVAALHARHAATTDPGGVEERLTLGTRLVEVATASRRSAHAGWGHLWRMDAFFQLGELAALPVELAELEILAERLNQPLFRWHVLRARASLAHVTGRFADAERFTEAALAVGRAEQHPQAELLYHATQALVALERGSPGPIETAIAMVEQQPFPLTPISLAFAMRMELALGRRDVARDRFEDLMTVYPRRASASVWFVISGYLAEVAVELGSTEQMSTLYQSLAPYGRSFVVDGAGAVVCFGSAARHLGVLAAGLELWVEAEQHLEEAVERNLKAGALPFAVHAQVSLADVLARRSELGRALEMARSAARTAARLGMKPLEERTLRQIRRLERAGPRLSPREREVASLVARGLSNREIGTVLHLSDRTAENHVKHILDKLGFSSRTQIAAWAVAQGLTPRREIEYRT